MSFRDENEALRGRVEHLEQELGDARKALEARAPNAPTRTPTIDAFLRSARRTMWVVVVGWGLAAAALLTGAAMHATALVWAGVAIFVASSVAGYVMLRCPACHGVVPLPVRRGASGECPKCGARLLSPR